LPPSPPTNHIVVCKTLVRVPRGFNSSIGWTFRLLLRGSMTEAYINDEFLVPVAADSDTCAGGQGAMPVTGRIGLVVSPSAATQLDSGVGSIRGWGMTLGDCAGACGRVGVF
jgi:hypothetical protein